jgi:RNA polymerase sigma factor (TIGR02999 family)
VNGDATPHPPNGQTPRAARPVDDLYSMAYDELRRRASIVRRSDPFASAISTRTLIHETWLKFSKSTTVRFESERHLLEIVVRAMRQVLVDLARYRRAGRRSAIVVPIENELIAAVSDTAAHVIAVNDALADLEQVDPELANIVQMRYYGGFSMIEIADHLGTSESTVYRKYTTAMARLKVALQDDA